MKTDRKDQKLSLQKDTVKHIKALTVQSGMKTGTLRPASIQVHFTCTTECPM